MKKDRIPEIHFYEWSITRWFTSSTRLILSAAGRGIFRELMDTCYAQGSIPKDPLIQSRIAGCTIVELEEAWPFIARHFVTHKHDKNLLTNRFADMYRANYFKFISKQRRNGKASADKKVTDKSNEVSNMGNGGGNGGVNHDSTNTILHDTIRHDTSCAESADKPRLGLVPVKELPARAIVEAIRSVTPARDRIEAAFERHKCYKNGETFEHAVRMILSMDVDWEKFDKNHDLWCEHWERVGWNSFGSLTFIGWIQANMPLPPSRAAPEKKTYQPELLPLEPELPIGYFDEIENPANVQKPAH